MIINIRGTHGSGKTTLVRKALAKFKRRKPIYIKTGRRNPIGYICDNRVFVVGHYEGDFTGGCDTILLPDLMFDTIQKYAKRGLTVLFEGIVAQHSVPRVLELRDAGFKVRILQLDIPVKVALRDIKRRRKRAGTDRPFNPENTIRESKAVLSSAKRLKEAGIRVSQFTTRKAARTRLFKLLELT